jgi:hypothetical protein
MSIEALEQAKSTLESVRSALGIYAKTEVDMTLGMLDRAIAESVNLDAICQDLQEMTYTQAMRIAELEAQPKRAVSETHKPLIDEIKKLKELVVFWQYDKDCPAKVVAELLKMISAHDTTHYVAVYTHPPTIKG